MESCRFSLTSRDSLTFVGVGARLLAVAVAASVGPTRRAMRIDPAEAPRGGSANENGGALRSAVPLQDALLSVIESAPPCRPARGRAGSRRLNRALDGPPVLLDQLRDVFGALAGLRAGVGDGPAESYVVTHVVDAPRILEQGFDIVVSHAEVAVAVATIVRLVAF